MVRKRSIRYIFEFKKDIAALKTYCHVTQSTNAPTLLNNKVLEMRSLTENYELISEDFVIPRKTA